MDSTQDPLQPKRMQAPAQRIRDHFEREKFRQNMKKNPEMFDDFVAFLAERFPEEYAAAHKP
jgi:hypothetical protein